MPKTIRWIILCAILFLVVLSIYRLGIYYLFPEVFEGAKPGIGQAFWWGLRFDGRVVAVISLLMVLTSYWPGLHFFRGNMGKWTAISFYGFFMTILLLCCIAEIGYLNSFHLRLQGTLLFDFAKSTDKWQVYRSKSPWLVFFLLVVGMVSLFVFFIKILHQQISKAKRSNKGAVRRYWQVFLVIICLLAIYGRVGVGPLTVSKLSGQVDKPVLDLALNPVESVWHSLSEINNKP